MRKRTTRRRFLQTTAAGGAAILGGPLGIAAGLPPVGTQETKIEPTKVEFDASIEPLVRVLEETPRDRAIEEIARRVKNGLPYRDVLTALLLAGIRNIRPRPHVGFKFHAVLVVHSCHLASVSSPATDRWLPILWAVDDFKRSQASDVSEGDWTMAAVNESGIPDPAATRAAFRGAMDAWDEAAADVAAAGLGRTASVGQAFDDFCLYAARDYRDIGHKAIYVANAFRTLDTMGVQHAEPVYRSLAYALLKHEGESPAKRDDPVDRPFRENRERVRELDEHWLCGRYDEGAVTSFTTALRTATPSEASGHVIDLVKRGVHPRSAWDAMFAYSGELVMRQPGILPLHAVTTANAVHYLFHHTSDESTRKLLLLQMASFLPLFRESAKGRGELRERRIDELQPSEKAPGSLASIFAEVNRDRDSACRQALHYLESGADPNALVAEARRLIFAKGTNAHDYKFSSAVLEDYATMHGAARSRFLASSLYLLRGSAEADSGLIARVRAAGA